MTPARAKEIAEENGCSFKTDPCNWDAWLIERQNVGQKIVDKEIFNLISEPDFIAFYIPDERD